MNPMQFATDLAYGEQAAAPTNAPGEYAALLAQRTLAYRWFAEHAQDEALKSIYTSIWQAVAEAKRTWMDLLHQSGTTATAHPVDWEVFAALRANASLPPSAEGIYSLLDWLNELDAQQQRLAQHLDSEWYLPAAWKRELQQHRREAELLRGPLRYLTQYAGHFAD